MNIPIKIYERITNALTSDFCTNLSMNIVSTIALQNIGGDLYAVYVVKKRNNVHQ